MRASVQGQLIVRIDCSVHGEHHESRLCRAIHTAMEERDSGPLRREGGEVQGTKARDSLSPVVFHKSDVRVQLHAPLR